MAEVRGWSLHDRFSSAAGLLVIATFFAAAAWWLGTATLSAKADSDRLSRFRDLQSGMVYRTKDGGAGSAMIFLGAGTLLTGGISGLSILGAVVVLLMRPPKEEE
ncbi:MAG: hypothetical protein KF691_08710 [Phycisphaeraceae bacterium]|nr:hypothetical protein [Phycisphaeraceae bacterium]